MAVGNYLVEATQSSIRVCFRLRRNRPRLSHEDFLADLESVAKSLGTPVWRQPYEQLDRIQGEDPEPTVLFGPQTAFVRYTGDLSRVLAALSPEPSVAAPLCYAGTVVGPGTWTISLMQEGLQKTVRSPIETSVCITTDAHEVFAKNLKAAKTAPAKATVIAAGVNDPNNVGSMFRLMGCFGLDQLLHVYSATEPPLWTDVHRAAAMKATAQGCEQHVRRQIVPVNDLLQQLAKADRPPVVAIETATDAQSLCTFEFPESCAIMVGSESHGIQASVVRALRPGFDSFVVIPMCGPHVSLNVATALGMALYEYRRQWPGASS